MGPPHGWQQPPRKKGKGPGFWFLVIGLPLVALVGCMATLGALVSQPSGPADRVQVARASAPAETATGEAVTDDAATEESTPEAEPSPTPSAEPTPRTYSGTGAKVLKLRKSDWDDVWLASFTHRGQSNFIVHALNPRGAMQDGLINEIGNYEGTVLMNVEDGAKVAALEIKADGPWTLKLKPLTMARVWSGGKLSGRGDEVVRLDPASSGLVTMESKHSGESNFIVHGFADDGQSGLINEIGSWHGEVLLPDGTFLMTIHADGVWAFTQS